MMRNTASRSGGPGRRALRHGLAVLLYLPVLALAQTAPRAAYTPPPAPVTAGSVLQIVLSLALVLALVGVVAWLLRRISLPQNGSGNLVKVLNGVAVGQRERIVLVEVGDTWLVVGVAPGQVRTLHSMPKSELPPTSAGAVAGADGKNFQTWLKQMMEKRSASQ